MEGEAIDSVIIHCVYSEVIFVGCLLLLLLFFDLSAGLHLHC